MADELKSSDGTENSSTATPDKNGTKSSEKSPSATSAATSHIVDATEEWLGRSIIITGAPEPRDEKGQESEK